MEGLHPEFCAFPFVQLSTHPTGRIVPCCWNDYDLGNIQEQSIEEIWNSEKMQNLRNEFLIGEIKICAEHIKNRQCYKWSSHLIKYVKPSPQQELKDVKALYAQLNGKCNLECIMCDVWTLPNGLFTEEKFWGMAESAIFPNLREIYISGGEPFLLKDTYRLIEQISAVNRNCLFKFSTNAHWRFSDKLKSSLDKINIRLIFISIDSLDEAAFSKIRLKGELKQVLETVEAICAYREERKRNDRSYFELGIETAIQKDNYTEIADFIQFARQRNIQNTFSFVYSPLPLSLLNFDTQKKFEALTLFLAELQKTSEKTIINLIVPLFESLTAREKLDFLLLQLKTSSNNNPERKNGFSFPVRVNLGKSAFVFTLEHGDHRIHNLRILQKIFTEDHHPQTVSYTDSHEFWANYHQEILPFATAVDYPADLPEHFHEDTASHFPLPEEITVSTIELQSVIEKYSKPSEHKEPWRPVIAMFLILMIKEGFSLRKAAASLELLLKTFTFLDTGNQDEHSLVKIILDLKQWAEMNPEKIKEVETLYQNELKNWEQEKFMRSIFTTLHMEQTLQRFGEPGGIYNTGWISLSAMAFVICEGKFLADGNIQKVAQFIDHYAPNFPHPARHYLFDGYGDDFIPDSKKWAEQYPGEVSSVEYAYQEAYKTGNGFIRAARFITGESETVNASSHLIKIR